MWLAWISGGGPLSAPAPGQCSLFHLCCGCSFQSILQGISFTSISFLPNSNQNIWQFKELKARKELAKDPKELYFDFGYELEYDVDFEIRFDIDSKIENEFAFQRKFNIECER